MGYSFKTWVCLGMLACTSAAYAADPALPQSRIIALTPAELEQERLKKLIAEKPEAYVDKVMDVNELIIDESDDSQAPTEDNAGIRRTTIESRAGVAHSTNNNGQSATASQLGLRAEYQQETLNYGLLTLQADLRQSFGDDYIGVSGPWYTVSSNQSGRLTLSNDYFPITTQVFANTKLGDMQSDLTRVLDRQNRFSLGSATLRGASTNIYSRDFDLSIGSGLRGSLQGGPYPGFERTQGEMSWLGYSQSVTDDISLGAQLTHTTGIQNYFGIDLGVYTPQDMQANITNLATAIKYGDELFRDGDQRARLTLIHSDYDPQGTGSALGIDSLAANGLFADGGFVTGRYRHEFGFYKADPGLSYADYVLAADSQGVYWRVNYNGLRTNWGLGADYDEQNPDKDNTRRQGTRIGGNAYLYHRLARDQSVGGSVNFWQTDFSNPGTFALADEGTRSLYANLYYQQRFEDLGNSRFSARIYNNDQRLSNGPAATGEEIE